jgi:DNA-binding NarL/FixJ family response regulator
MSTTILLVEPHDHVNAAFKKAIAGSKYEIVDEAKSGEEAIEKYRNAQNRPDLVVMDMIFPGLGGIGTMEEILKFHDRARVVLIHDKKSAFRQMEATRKGAKAHIRYPFAAKEKVLEQLAVAEGGGGGAEMGSEDHFAKLAKPVAVEVRKRGLFSFLSGKQSGLSERLSIHQIEFMTEKPYKEGDLLQLGIRFADPPESVPAKVTRVRAKGSSFEVSATLNTEKPQRDRLRKLIVDAATKA